MAKITDPDDLTQGVNITISTASYQITLNEGGILVAADGVTLQAVYSFLKEEWKDDDSLIPHPFPIVAITEESMEVGDTWDWGDADTKTYIRDGGWALKSGSISNEEYMNVTTLGTFVGGLDQAYYQQAVSDRVPVFAHVNGQVSIRYVRKSIETGMAKLGREFDAEELVLLDYLDEVTQRPDLVVTMHLSPGDMQFVNNYAVLHSRTSYKDHPDPAKRRHLLRLWLKVDKLRQLDPRFVEYDETTGWSRREGIRPPHAPPPGECQSHEIRRNV